MKSVMLRLVIWTSLLMSVTGCARHIPEQYGSSQPGFEQSRQFVIQQIPLMPVPSEVYKPRVSVPPAIALIPPAPKQEDDKQIVIADVKALTKISSVNNIASKASTIVIDAGHGGEDAGTESKQPKYQEKLLTLSTAVMLKNFLEQMGYKTVMIRTSDIFISRADRVKATNDLKANLFVSIHYNSAPKEEAEGVEIFYHRSNENKDRSKESKLLAESILKKVLYHTKAKSRGIKHGNWTVIKETQIPAILIEGGFLTNETERAKLRNPIYLKQIAWGIATGIHAYLEDINSKKGAG